MTGIVESKFSDRDTPEFKKALKRYHDARCAIYSKLAYVERQDYPRFVQYVQRRMEAIDDSTPFTQWMAVVGKSERMCELAMMVDEVLELYLVKQAKELEEIEEEWNDISI